MREEAAEALSEMKEEWQMYECNKQGNQNNEPKKVPGTNVRWGNAIVVVRSGTVSAGDGASAPPVALVAH